MGRTYTEAQRRRNIDYQRAYRKRKIEEDKEWHKKEADRTKVNVYTFFVEIRNKIL